MSIRGVPPSGFGVNATLAIVGAGAAGLCAALAANEAGAEVVVLEGDALPAGSTALSAGLIPAAGTRFQQALGITDSAERFAIDIRRKAHDEADVTIVNMVARESCATVQWLADRYGFPFTVVDDFDYPGHSARRMHGLPSRTGVELIDRLRQIAEQQAIPILVNGKVTGLFADADHVVRGVEIQHPDGTQDRVAARPSFWPATVMAPAGISLRATFWKCTAHTISVIPAIAATPWCGDKLLGRSFFTFPDIRDTARSPIRMAC